MKKSSPLGVISSSGLCGHYFIKRFAVFFESSYLVANVSQHVAIRDHFGFAADGAVSRNNDGLVCHRRDICFRCFDHPVNVSAGRIIDERVMSVPPRVAGVQDISFNKISRDIAIGMSWAIMFKRDGDAIKMKRLVSREQIGWNRARPARPEK